MRNNDNIRLLANPSVSHGEPLHISEEQPSTIPEVLYRTAAELGDTKESFICSRMELKFTNPIDDYGMMDCAL